MISIPLFFDSRKGQGKSENFTTSFSLSIPLDIRKNYEIALISSQIWYSWYNITESNNKYFYKSDSGVPKWLEIPPGSYKIRDLNDEIKFLIKQKGSIFVLLESSILLEILIDDESSITLKPNHNTLKSFIEIKNSYGCFRILHSVDKVIGFAEQYLGTNGIHDSENPVNITNINSLQIHCSFVNGSYINGLTSDLLYTVSPNVLPGYLIQVEPKQIVYVPIKNSNW